jgi:hypothetical protein
MIRKQQHQKEADAIRGIEERAEKILHRLLRGQSKREEKGEETNAAPPFAVPSPPILWGRGCPIGRERGWHGALPGFFCPTGRERGRHDALSRVSLARIRNFIRKRYSR